jgi:hypothetical protein
MKKVLLLFVFIFTLISCSSDDAPVLGCTDPNSINYNPDATENDNNCQYSIIGDWRITKYTLGSTNILNGYTSLNWSIYSNGTTRLEGVTSSAAAVGAGFTIVVNGTYIISGSNNNIITLTNTDPGTADIPSTVWTFKSITGTTFSITSDDVLGNSGTIEAIKI